MRPKLDDDAEWLEADGLGGFASGTVSGRRTRRYHALLLTATTPPTGRMVLVNGFDAFIKTSSGSFWISSQEYAQNTIAPNGASHLVGFESEPWPRWTYRLGEATRIVQEIFVPRGMSAVFLRWKMLGPIIPSTLQIRPFLSGRDYHSLHHQNSLFRFDADQHGQRIRWQPYQDVPGIIAESNGQYRHDPTWYMNFVYEAERNRGLDDTEDLAAPGIFTWDLASEDALLSFTTDREDDATTPTEKLSVYMPGIQQRERDRRGNFRSPVERAADSYIVSGQHRKTIVAGYPWFTDWGRDTFIAMRGLCLGTGRLDDARDILLAWAGAVDQGMLPNRFPDHGDVPAFNSVDASLWFIIACHDYLEAMKVAQRPIASSDEVAIGGAIEAILNGYSRGTRFQIRADQDGLLAAGEPGLQLTWMDAKVGDWVVTPRIGKPVEVQALWINSLWIGSQFSNQWHSLYQQARASFGQTFWNPVKGCLYDVIDLDHRPGENDDSMRPNQILAVGGLPLQLLEGDQATSIVDRVEASLLTPLGLRSLEPNTAGYVPHYAGDVLQRDGAYHQGTVWPWLIGPFVEAWVRIRTNTNAAKREARDRFLPPLMGHLDHAGLGHVSEIADGNAPFTPRGCPFQAWSLGELIRLSRVVLAGSSDD